MRLSVITMALVICSLNACDSPSTTKDPDASYFVKFYGRDGDQEGKDVVILPDGNMVLFGTSRPTQPTLATQWYVVKVDPKGNVFWEKEFGGLLDDEARDIELTSTGNLVLVGNTYKTSTDRDILIITINTDGTKLDSARIPVRDALDPFGGSSDGDEDVASVSEALDGGFLIAGTTTYVANKPNPTFLPDPHDALKVRVDASLDVFPSSWVQNYGYVSDDASQKIVQVSATKFYVFGYTNTLPPGQTTQNYNFWVYELGVDGDFVNQSIYPGTPSAEEKLSSFSFSPTLAAPDYFLGGLTRTGSGPSDFYVTKLRNPLEFNSNDIQFEKSLSINLGTGLEGHTAVAAALGGGFLVMGNENGFDNNQNWVLTKLFANGTEAWNIPIVFGGEGFDTCGAIQQLPDGRIILVGTMRTGRPDVGEFKLTLVKVNAEGKLQN